MAKEALEVSLAAIFIYELFEGIKDGVKSELQKAVDDLAKDLGRVGVEAGLRVIGLELDDDGQINAKTITDAINRAYLNERGIEFTNLFDKAAVIADCRRIAIEKASEAFGFSGGLGINGLVDAVRLELMGDARSQIAALGGDMVEGARPLATTLALLSAEYRTDWQQPRTFTAKAESNRARQAKYRALHQRKWVAI